MANSGLVAKTIKRLYLSSMIYKIYAESAYFDKKYVFSVLLSLIFKIFKSILLCFRLWQSQWRFVRIVN